jgi:DNA-binding IclR family transcriptional regulator
VARLGIADFLSNGPLDANDLAQQSKTHAPSLRRVLRLLAAADVFAEDSEGRFALTPIGLVAPENLIRADSRNEAESAHDST